MKLTTNIVQAVKSGKHMLYIYIYLLIKKFFQKALRKHPTFCGNALKAKRELYIEADYNSTQLSFCIIYANPQIFIIY